MKPKTTPQTHERHGRKDPSIAPVPASADFVPVADISHKAYVALAAVFALNVGLGCKRPDCKNYVLTPGAGVATDCSENDEGEDQGAGGSKPVGQKASSSAVSSGPSGPSSSASSGGGPTSCDDLRIDAGQLSGLEMDVNGNVLLNFNGQSFQQPLTSSDQGTVFVVALQGGQVNGFVGAEQSGPVKVWSTRVQDFGISYTWNDLSNSSNQVVVGNDFLSGGDLASFDFEGSGDVKLAFDDLALVVGQVNCN